MTLSRSLECCRSKTWRTASRIWACHACLHQLLDFRQGTQLPSPTQAGLLRYNKQQPHLDRVVLQLRKAEGITGRYTLFPGSRNIRCSTGHGLRTASSPCLHQRSARLPPLFLHKTLCRWLPAFQENNQTNRPQGPPGWPLFNSGRKHLRGHLSPPSALSWRSCRNKNNCFVLMVLKSLLTIQWNVRCFSAVLMVLMSLPTIQWNVRWFIAVLRSWPCLLKGIGQLLLDYRGRS